MMNHKVILIIRIVKIYLSLFRGRLEQIGFACSYNTNALGAFTPIQDNIIIVKDGTGYAYLPDYD